ncbi:WSC-domain-containing protein [Pholiota conissans]|uniref:WSC-domain-containing protein n=1 Tax=Pholiota conissans TaxID=109636 RepID=A0A9P6CS13_9AGAR|nr:WSC-domain-containing protein [Pholiota conissans]
MARFWYSLFLAVVGSGMIYVNASPALTLEGRQSSPGLPAGWQTVGCFSDTPASRTLKIAAFTDITNMTIESCIAFCTPNVYQYAGVEFSRECYCDNVIEAPGVPISEDDCNMPCTGNSDEICGGSGAINIFSLTTVTPPPPTATIKTTVGSFQYKGCFQDGVNGAPRSLAHQLTISGGVTAETCTAACKTAGFALAGLEFGQECWCDSYMEIVTLTPDTDCNMACNADPTEICGAGNRLAVYQDTTATPPGAQTCLTNSQIHSITFGLQAVPLNGGTPLALGAFELAAVIEAPSWFLLSNGGTGPPPNEAVTFTLGSNGVFSPTNFFGEGLPIPLAPNVGCIQVFGVPFNNPLVAYNQYCAMPNPVSTFGPFIGPPVLAVNGRSDLWGLCPNITQAAKSEFRPGPRLDVVFSPTAANTDYVLSSCKNVVLQIQ